MNIKKKHAYLIIAHSDEYCLNHLLKCLDDSRNDIYLLIDTKSSLNISFKPCNSSLHFVKRYDIRWGDLSLVKAELRLIETATANGRYSYYHLLSGQDLPIKTQDYIHDYFGSLPSGSNLIGFCSDNGLDKVFDERISYRLFFTRNLRDNGIRGRVLSKLRDMALNFQKSLGLTRKFKDFEIRKGAQWCSFTDEFARYAISRSRWIKKTFSHIFAPDEIALQTLIWNSPFKHTIHNLNDEYEGCMRAIDWNRGRPYIWRKGDFEELMESGKLFARKFNSMVDKEIIDMVYNRIMSVNQSK